MSILLSILAGIAVMIAKGWQVQAQLANQNYRRTTFGLISLAWMVTALPIVVSACNETVCQWSLNFGWWTGLVRQISPFDKLNSDTMTAVIMFSFIVLTVYFFGHCLGWAIYSARSLLRLAMSR